MTRLPEAHSVKRDWLAAMIRNYVEQDDVMRENGAVVVQMPNDPGAICVLQRDGNHLLIQVLSADVVIA